MALLTVARQDFGRERLRHEKDSGGHGGGYYYAATSADITAAMSALKEDTLGEVDTTDSDGDGEQRGDGLYAVFECAEGGMVFL